MYRLSKLTALSRSFSTSAWRGLSETLTDEMKVKLAGKYTRKKFRLAAIADELKFLEKTEFPLPAALSEEQWQQLMRFEDRMTRVHYFDALHTTGQPVTDAKFEELLQQDQTLSGPLVLDPKMVDDFLKKDPSHQVVLDTVMDVHRKLQASGERVVTRVNTVTDFLGLMDPLQNTDQGIKKCLRFLTQKANMDALGKIHYRAKKAKEDEVIEEAKKKKFETNSHIVYGLGENTIFHRINQRVMERGLDHKVIREYHEWGQPLVIDLGFVKTLSYRHVKSLMLRELPFGLMFNRTRPEPLAIYLTSYDPECPKCNLLSTNMQRIHDPDYPAIVTEKHFTELFPAQDLLYLTPDSRKDLTAYDARDVYVIGGIVDQTGKNKQTLTLARQMGIRHARLPTQRYRG